MIDFLSSLFEPDDLLEVRYLPSGRRFWARCADLMGHHTKMQAENAIGQGVYVGANPRSRNGGKAKDVALARCVFVDMDNTYAYGEPRWCDGRSRRV